MNEMQTPPRWLQRLATFDGIDTVLLFFGLPTAYAAGGVPGLFLAGLLFGGQIVVRKTPLLPHTLRALDWSARVLRGDTRLLRAGAAQVFQFLEDEAASIPPAQLPAMEVSTAKQTASISRTIPGHRKARYRGLERLPSLEGYQIVIYGPTRSGKSSVIKALLITRQDAELIILDPHYEPGSWPGRANVVGPGLNWAAIDRAIDYTLSEMQARYRRLAASPRGTLTFRPLVLAVDEMSALAMEIPDAGKRLFNLAQQGRKVSVWTILTPHSTEVVQMGAQGRGDARENFAYIEMPLVTKEDQHMPRVVTVYHGNPRRKDNAPVGRYIVPAPKEYTGSPALNPERICGGRDQRVPEGMSGSSRHTVPGDRHTAGPSRHTQIESDTSFSNRTEFFKLYSRESEHARHLAEYLLRCGYGTRKISVFLPFANTEARALVHDLQAGRSMPLGTRPAPQSPEEVALVQRLRQIGAPLRRIAALLDGNDSENLTRIETYPLPPGSFNEWR